MTPPPAEDLVPSPAEDDIIDLLEVLEEGPGMAGIVSSDGAPAGDAFDDELDRLLAASGAEDPLVADHPGGVEAAMAAVGDSDPLDLLAEFDLKAPEESPATDASGSMENLDDLFANLGEKETASPAASQGADIESLLAGIGAHAEMGDTASPTAMAPESGQEDIDDLLSSLDAEAFAEVTPEAKSADTTLDALEVPTADLAHEADLALEEPGWVAVPEPVEPDVVQGATSSHEPHDAAPSPDWGGVAMAAAAVAGTAGMAGLVASRADTQATPQAIAPGELEAIHARLAALEQSLTSAPEPVDSQTRQRLDELATQVVALQAAHGQLEARQPAQDEVSQRLCALEEAKVAAERLTEFSADLGALRQEAAALNQHWQQMADVPQRLDGLETRLAQVPPPVDADGLAADLDAKLQALTASLATRHQATDQSLDALQTQFATTESLPQRLDALEVRLAQVPPPVDADGLTADLDGKLQTLAASQNQRLESAGASLAALEMKVASLDHLPQRLAAAETTLAHLPPPPDMSSVHTALEEKLQALATTLSSRHEATEQTLGGLHSKLAATESLVQRLDGLEAELAQLPPPPDVPAAVATALDDSSLTDKLAARVTELLLPRLESALEAKLALALPAAASKASQETLVSLRRDLMAELESLVPAAAAKVIREELAALAGEG